VLIASTLTGGDLVHVVAGHARFRFILYNIVYNRIRDICHESCGHGMAGYDAFVVGPGDFDYVVAWVSGWVGAASVWAVCPACFDFSHSISFRRGRAGRRRKTCPPTGLMYLADVHTHVACSFCGFYV
jgi:hypothetical protein